MTEEKGFKDCVMSEEELDNVAGGTYREIADDSRFLNSLNGSTDRYGERRIEFTPGKSIEEEVRRGWKTVGIDFKYPGSLGCVEPCEYFLDGKQITQDQARQHAMKVTGRHMTEKDWKW